MSAIGLSKYVKIKALSPLSFPGKIRLLFALFGLFFARKRARPQVGGSESKCDISYFTHTIPCQFPVKKVGSNTFQLCGYRSQKIFKFGCFSRYHAYIFEKSGSDILMQNLMLNRLAPISNPKMKNQKASVLLYNCPFSSQHQFN